MGKYKYWLNLALVLLAASFLQAGDGQAQEGSDKGEREAGRTVPNVETIVASMEQATAENRARSRPYTVTRDYKLFGKDQDKTKSRVMAEVSFLPPDSKSYAIQQADGSGHGVRIVRKILEKEAQLTKDSSSTAISRENYDFRFIREEEVCGQRCYVLELIPKRRDKKLLQGTILVKANTYLIHRVEGRPVVSPSWWLRDVTITLDYGDVGGMWLQTASEATANVRLLGHYTMVARDVKYTMSEVAAATPANR
jgi:hypothetical protein